MTWAGENAVAFDPSKAVVIYFLGPCARLRDLPSIKKGRIEKAPSVEVRWLGVFRDQVLKFQRHIWEWTKKRDWKSNYGRYWDSDPNAEDNATSSPKEGDWYPLSPHTFRRKMNHVSSQNLKARYSSSSTSLGSGENERGTLSLTPSIN